MTGWVGAVTAALLALSAPALLRRLPEPTIEQLPANPVDDDRLQAQLRLEGPKELYTGIASRRWFLPMAVVLAAGFGAVTVRAGVGWFSWAAVVVAPLMAVLTIVDVRTRLLPSRLVVSAATSLLVATAVDALHRGNVHVLSRALLGAVTVYAVYWLIRQAAPSSFGGGDVRLAFPLALLLGAQSWKSLLVGLYGGFILFTVFAVLVLLVRLRWSSWKRQYPFGPFMIVGAYAGMALSPHVRILG